jgi:hypothetical protein
MNSPSHFCSGKPLMRSTGSSRHGLAYGRLRMCPGFATKTDRQSAWQCGGLLSGLECNQRYGIFADDDVLAGEPHVGKALKFHGMTLLRSAYLQMSAGEAVSGIPGSMTPAAVGPTRTRRPRPKFESLPTSPSSIGSVGLPFRFDCRREITLSTLPFPWNCANPLGLPASVVVKNP